MIADDFNHFVLSLMLRVTSLPFCDNMERDRKVKQRTRRSKYDDCFNQLPQEFTVEDVERLMDVTNNAAKMHCSRWVQAGYTKRKRQGTYQKLLSDIKV